MMSGMCLVTAPVDPTVRFLGKLRASPRRLQPLIRPVIQGALAGVAVAVLGVAGQVMLRDNVRQVQPGRVFRAAQMEPDRLREFIREHGIQTVVNLRGCCVDFDWYRGECQSTHEANVSQEDVTLSAIRLPTPSEVRRLIEVLQRSAYPLLLHCRQGVDRTGLAAVMVRLLEPEISLAEAERHLGLGYGYVAYNGTESMRRFYQLYRQWLVAMGQEHSPRLFQHWATREYCPGRCRARMQYVDLPGGGWPMQQAVVVTVRAENTSLESWPLRPGKNHGVHLRYRLSGPVSVEGRAGQFDRLVQPGEFIDLRIGLPPLPPGDYSLSAGLVDADENAFSQFGVAPLLYEFRVDR